MKTVAFVTYNTVGSGLSSGWHESGDLRALVLQNTKGRSWAAAQSVSKNSEQYVQETAVVAGQIGNLWDTLAQEIPNLDHVVIYVGSDGSENAIALAAKTLPAQKVTFVGCSCGISHKLFLVADFGLAGAGWVDCECGGHRTMRAIFERFMATGKLR